MEDIIVHFIYCTNIPWLEVDGHSIRIPVVSTPIYSHILRF
jgi:hypothetical protein